MKIEKELRFGIMCYGKTFQKWQAIVVEKLLEEKNIQCQLLIIDDRINSENKINTILKKLSPNTLLWTIFYFFMKKKSTAMQKINLKNKLSKVDELKCSVNKKGKYSEYFNELDLLKIEKYNLDFILRFGFGIIRGKILKITKYGIWSFHHGDEELYKGGPPGFWEIYDKQNVTSAILQKLNNKLDAGIILKSGSLKTDLSYIKNLDQILLESANWPIKICKNILNDVQIKKFGEKSVIKKSKIYKSPNNLQFILFICKNFLQKLKTLYKKLLYTDYWNIGIVEDEISQFLDLEQKSDTLWFPNKKDRFYADPFSITDEKKNIHIFFEEYPYNKKKGVISYTKFKNGEFSKPIVVLEEPFHLSFPFLVKYGNDIFMIPESYQKKQVILYKATKFPLLWGKEKILIDDYAGVDNAIVKYNERWWMFTTDKKNGHYYNLNIFYADELFGEWVPHELNPVKTAVTSARSAGTPFVKNKKLYRPAMDYSKKLEGNVIINQIKTISNKEYEEIEFVKIKKDNFKDWNDKIHTLSEAGNYTVIDGCREEFVLFNKHLLKYKIINLKNKILKKI